MQIPHNLFAAVFGVEVVMPVAKVAGFVAEQGAAVRSFHFILQHQGEQVEYLIFQILRRHFGRVFQ